LSAPITGPSQEETQEEIIAPVILDIERIDIQCQPLSTDDLMATDEMASAPSTMLTMEQIGLQLEFTSGPVSIPATSSALATTSLQLIINSKSPMLVIDLDLMIINPTSLVANTLISLKTPLRLPSVSSVPLTVAPAMSSMIVTINIIETSSSRLSRSPRVIEIEKEFVAEMINTFYKSLSDASLWC